MISREASSPPENSAPSTPAPVELSYTHTPPPHRKRKHAAISRASAASPAPSDPGFPGSHSGETGGVVAANVHASASRPRLTVSRGPTFVPVSEGSIYHTTEQIAVNRLGFRYTPAGLAPEGSKIPYRTIESRPQGYVRVSWEDRNPLTKVTTDGLGICGDKGWRSARLNVPVREGKWFVEFKIVAGGCDKPGDSSTKEGPHVRLGWGRREARMDGPVGLDGYSYGYRDMTGDKVTLSRPRPYGEPFKTGDVVGMYISLPPKRKPKANDPHDPAHMKRERIAIDFKGQEYFESLEYTQSKEMIALMDSTTNKAKGTAPVPSSSKKSATVKNIPERGRGKHPVPEESTMQPLPVLRNSHIAFFVNGKSQGVAFNDLYDYLQLRKVSTARKDKGKKRLREGMTEHSTNNFDDGWLGYYPFISLFNNAQVRINAGPEFECPPPADIEGVLAGVPDSDESKTRTWRPLCERYTEFMAEQWEMDALDESQAQGKVQQQRTTMEEPSAPVHRPKPPQRSQLRHESTDKVSKSQGTPRPPSQTPSQTLPSQVRDPDPVELQPVPLASFQTDTQLRPAQFTTREQQEQADAEAKAAARRERKRILERQRRARKAEEARVAKAKEKETQDMILQSHLQASSSLDYSTQTAHYAPTPSAPTEDYAMRYDPLLDPVIDPALRDPNLDPALFSNTADQETH